MYVSTKEYRLPELRFAYNDSDVLLFGRSLQTTNSCKTSQNKEKTIKQLRLIHPSQSNMKSPY